MTNFLPIDILPIMIGLDNLDNKILKLLGEEPAHTSELSRKTGVLRTTVQYRLNRLLRAGLVRKNKKGVASVWQPVYRNPHNKSLCQIYRGKDIIYAYEQLLSLPSQTLIFSIQGSSAARGEFKKLPSAFIKKAHRVFKRKMLVMKGASNKKALEGFNDINKTLIKSHVGRPQGIKMFFGNEFTAPGELMSTEKFLLLANPEQDFAVVIKDKGITKVINDTMKIFFDALGDEKTFDLNYYLKNLLS